MYAMSCYHQQDGRGSSPMWEKTWFKTLLERAQTILTSATLHQRNRSFIPTSGYQPWTVPTHCHLQRRFHLTVSLCLGSFLLKCSSIWPLHPLTEHLASCNLRPLLWAVNINMFLTCTLPRESQEQYQKCSSQRPHMDWRPMLPARPPFLSPSLKFQSGDLPYLQQPVAQKVSEEMLHGLFVIDSWVPTPYIIISYHPYAGCSQFKTALLVRSLQLAL